MPTPALPLVDRLVDRLTPEIAGSENMRGALWNVWGPVAGGKSTLLRQLAERLREAGLLPVLVAPPARQRDSGPLALIQAGVALRDAGEIDGELERIRSEGSWLSKVGLVRGWLESRADRLVILCDEPLEWPSADFEEHHFADHAEAAVTGLLGDLPCRRVVTGKLPSGLWPTQNPLLLDVRSAGLEWLKSAGTWGCLTSSAVRVADECGEDLERRSPLEVRLLVGLAALLPEPGFSRWWGSQLVRRDISRKLASHLEASDDERGRFLRSAWARMSLARQPIPQEMLERLVGPPPDDVADAVLKRCLLHQAAGEYAMHWTLRKDVGDETSWLSTQEGEARRKLAECYLERADADAGTSAGVGSGSAELPVSLEGAEAFHHASMMGDRSIIDRLRPCFADQLDILGKVLSQDLGHYSEAAEVFELACRLDPEDDYAHHYLAYNLDIKADRPPEVEEHYRRAIQIDPANTWWRSRWINYLITRGRLRPAHQAWSEASDALGLRGPRGDPWTYENLHIWVARLLVHRGQLDFAQEVLRGVPTKVREDHYGLAALWRRLQALLEARRVGAVFPLSIPPDRWWMGPHLSSMRRDSDHRAQADLARWMAGRIDAVDEQGVHIHVAQPPADGVPAKAKHGYVTITAADFDRWSLDDKLHQMSAGRFLELAWYGDDPDPAIRAHRAGEWQDRDLPPLFPDPARYLREAGWVEQRP